MSFSFVIQVFLPTLIPLAAGYALARFAGVSTPPLRTVARYVFFPVLLFVLLVGPLTGKSMLIVTGAGAAMALALFFAIEPLSRLLKVRIDASAAYPNIAAFSMPFLVLTWQAKDVGPRV